MKGHFVNPSWESSSFGRDESIIDRVPMGDLKKNYDKMTKMDHEFGLMWLLLGAKCTHTFHDF